MGCVEWMVLVATKQCSSRLVIGSITTMEAHQTHKFTINIILRFLWCSFLLPAWFVDEHCINFRIYGTLRRYRQWDNDTLGNDVWLGQAKASALETIYRSSKCLRFRGGNFRRTCILTRSYVSQARYLIRTQTYVWLYGHVQLIDRYLDVSTRFLVNLSLYYHYYVYSNIPSSMNWCVASTGPSTAYIHNLHGLPCKGLMIREHMCKQPPPSIVEA